MTAILGLRTRLVALLAISCAVALAVMAATLLGPLEQRLLDDETENLRLEAQRDLPVLVKAAGRPPRPSEGLQRAAQQLERAGGAQVTVVRRDGTVLATTDPDHRERFPDATRALRDGRVVAGRIGTGGEQEIGVAVPTTVGIAIVVRKPLDDVRGATNVVRRATVVAAIVSLLIAVVVGSVLAGHLVYRVRRLRDAALKIAEQGPTAEYVPDSSPDEIGDLARSFAVMQKQLRDQENARRAFVATASHELRTPLASLRLMLDMSREELATPNPDLTEARRQVGLADRQADHLASLSAELLDLSRLDAGVPLRSEALELDQIAKAVVAEFQVRAAESDRPIRARAAPPVWATGDPGSVAQVIRLLIDNALRYGAGVVTVTAEQEHSLATVSVRDEGPGVHEDEHEAIFERFQRGSSHSPGTGFGLGLAIGRELARRMDGELRLVPTDASGHFVLSLPRAPIDTGA